MKSIIVFLWMLCFAFAGCVSSPNPAMDFLDTDSEGYHNSLVRSGSPGLGSQISDETGSGDSDGGIVKDPNTGLEWMAGPDRDTNWYEAKSWVQSLGSGWRMPTLDELAGLYKKGAGPRNMTPLLKTTGWWVWSGETIWTSSTALTPKGSLKEGRYMFLLGNRRWADRGLLFQRAGFCGAFPKLISKIVKFTTFIGLSKTIFIITYTKRDDSMSAEKYKKKTNGHFEC